MRRACQLLGCLTALAAPWLAMPVVAQNANQPPQMMPSPPPPPPDANEFPRERRELREQREQLRIEHEQLEDEHDRLKSACMDTKGQDRSVCVDRKNNLHGRMDEWHQRMQSFRETEQAEEQKANPDGRSIYAGVANRGRSAGSHR